MVDRVWPCNGSSYCTKDAGCEMVGQVGVVLKVTA